MMRARLANVAALVVMPFLLVGVINRVKSLWSGRKGPPIFQLAYDVRRLLRKSPVYSTTTTLVFRIAPYVLLVTSIGSATVAPLLGSTPLAAFPPVARSRRIRSHAHDRSSGRDSAHAD